MSLPIWERGLKLTALGVQVYPMHVAPYMGAWIETNIFPQTHSHSQVAPYMGAWIETVRW